MKLCHFTLVTLFLIFGDSHALKCHKCEDCVEGPISDPEDCDPDIAEARCGTWIDPSSGKTNRGCVEDPASIPNTDLCLCDSDLCNDGICPQQRLQCLQCGDKGSCVGPSSDLEMKPCQNYELNDECYVVADDDGTTYRGCVSDDVQTPGKQKCDALGPYCKTGPFNNQPGMTDFGCVKCASSDTDDRCGTETTRVSCNIPLGRETQCYTIFRNEEVIRDCYYGDTEKEKCDDAGENCEKCPTDGCNSKSFKSLKCRKSETNSGFCYVTTDNENDLACYHSIQGSNVKRGCLNSIPGEGAQDDCRRNSNRCKICKEPECNVKTSFQKCYQCNSADDENCAKLTDLAGLPEVTCPNYGDDQCATWIEEGDTVTHRDCSISSLNPLACICKDILCNDKDCPNGRLKCHQCEATSDCLNLQSDAEKITCRNYKSDDKCFTVVDDSLVAYRGCVSDTNTEGIKKCEASEFCMIGDDNEQPGVSDEFKCVQCQTDSISGDDSCARMNDKEATSCEEIPLGRSIGCYTLMDGDRVERGCYYGDKVKECDDNENCKPCEGSGCNDVPFRTLSCRKCDSKVDPDCLDKLSESPSGFCIEEMYSEEELACFRRETDGGRTVTRGCLNTIQDDGIKANCKKNTNECKICHKERCNKKGEFQRCYNCNSTITPNCATLANPTALPSLTCPGYLDQCAVYLAGIAAEDTIRSCISNSTLECPSTHCEPCSNNDCNKETYPRTRKRCHRCREDENPNCVNDLSASSEFLHYCPKYDKDYKDICFGVIEPTTNNMIRGCRTDFALHQKCLERGDKCLSCNATEGCNSAIKIAKPTLRCIDCEPSNLHGNCLWGVNAVNAVQCKEDVWFGDTEDCFTVEYGSDVVRRGCLNDFPEVCEESNYVTNCTKCHTNGCNNENVIRQGCVVCNSEETASCKLSNPNFEVTQCTEELQEFEERWCYTMTNPLDGEVRRGCFMDLSEDLKKFCLNSTVKMCDLCHDWGCNNERPPSSGNRRKVSVIAFIFVVLRVLYK